MKKSIIYSLLGVVFFSACSQKENVLYHSDAYTIYKDSVVQGEYTARIASPEHIISNYPNGEFPLSWQLTKDISAYPRFTSDQTISDAIYNLSVEEMTNLIEPDNTWRTGQEWAGVWTRDISYSIFLSVGHMNPEVSKNSLMRKVKNGLIIQDTGTGGAYPVSTDRIIWATAAWQIYKITGDKEWLAEIYPIIKKSIEQDERMAYNVQTGLVKGESSFLDWREQEYPRWMQPADIYESECLGTSIAHYQANAIAARIAEIMGEEPGQINHYLQNAEKIKKGINTHLWMEDKGYYAPFLYGRNTKMISPRSETLGEALSILFGITNEERQKRIMASVRQTPYGNPCLSPQIPNIPPYHNNGIWPFVQAYWLLASAKAGNETNVMESIAAIYRAAVLFVTNKENFVAVDGDFKGTEINSSNMLWSIAGNIAIVHKVFFGMEFEEDGLIFQPFIPKSFHGKKSLSNFKYRDASLTIDIKGYGNEIKSFKLDGKETTPRIPGDISGEHTIEIIMKNNSIDSRKINKGNVVFSPETPEVKLVDNRLEWNEVENALSYKVIKNSKMIDTTANLQYPVEVDGVSNEYQIIAVDKDGNEGFASEPILVINRKTFNTYTMQTLIGKSSIKITAETNTHLTFDVVIPETGKYAVSFCYANGNGPIGQENKCATRTLYINDTMTGIVAFPQRGENDWNNWGESNHVITSLQKGKQQFVLKYEWWNEKMNLENINEALLKEIKIIPIV